jgi:hypothetical protein
MPTLFKSVQLVVKLGLRLIFVICPPQDKTFQEYSLSFHIVGRLLGHASQVMKRTKVGNCVFIIFFHEHKILQFYNPYNIRKVYDPLSLTLQYR